jgi:hypothetical protein
MKHCNNENEQTKIMEKNKAFFAFNNEQFINDCDLSLNYQSLGNGLYCPACNVNALTKELKESWDFKIQWELSNNTLKDIIWYELANHESQITGDYSDALEALKPYNIKEDDIKKEWGSYYRDCIDKGYF